MAIDMATLQEEKVLLQKDFEEMKKNIQKVEVDLIQMKANMNAINGAIQQTDRLLNKLKNEPYVLSFPTAAGLESKERIKYWLGLADEHFQKLGVQHKSIKALNVND